MKRSQDHLMRMFWGSQHQLHHQRILLIKTLIKEIFHIKVHLRVHIEDTQKIQTVVKQVVAVLDPEKCTIGGQSEDSGKFHVHIRAPRHR